VGRGGNVGLWIKWDVNAHKDDKIASLTDMEFRAFITAISEAKQIRSGGVFKSREHLKACIGSRYGKAIDGLMTKGLLGVDQLGVVAILGWHRYQVDPTSSQRQAAYTARRRSESDGLTVSKRSRERAEKEQREKTPISPLGLGEILRRAQS
jgi:hypothetical protein